MNIIFGTLLSSILTLTILFINAEYIEHGDINTILMYFVVYALPIVISALIINLLINLLSERNKLKSKIFMVLGLALIFFAYSNLVEIQYYYLLKIIATPFLLSSFLVIFLNLKKIVITRNI